MFGVLGIGRRCRVEKGQKKVWSAPLGRTGPRYLTHVCKRGGCPPSAFRLLPCVSPPGACTPARVLIRAGPPILIVLDQNRKTSTCFADTLHHHYRRISPQFAEENLGRVIMRPSAGARTKSGRNNSASAERSTPPRNSSGRRKAEWPLSPAGSTEPSRRSPPGNRHN